VAEATRHLRLLLDSARDLNKDLDLEDTVSGVVEQAARLVRARLALVFLRDMGSDRFELEAAVGAGGEPAPPALAFKLGEGIAGRAVLFGRPLAVTGAGDPGDPLGVLDFRSALAVPMIREGAASGALVLIDRQLASGTGVEPAEFSPEDEEMAMTLAAHAALAIRNAQVYEEARRLDRLQSEFVAAVSHELRTPITQMKAALEIVDTYYGAALDIRGRDLLAISEAAVRTLEDQVELILASAEIETDALTLDLTTVSAREIADETAGRLLPVAARRGIRIEVEAPRTGTALVQVDRRRFVRALANLLSNAVKFSESGQAVRLEVEAEADRVRFHVIDRGIGIEPRDQAHIFHRFAQLDGSLTRRAGGTGLGLSVSRALVERHGGQILLRSRPGEGSRFTIEIPSAEAASQGERRDPLADVA
jgi:signal transduction histidine kinase